MSSQTPSEMLKSPQDGQAIIDLPVRDTVSALAGWPQGTQVFGPTSIEAPSWLLSLEVGAHDLRPLNGQRARHKAAVAAEQLAALEELRFPASAVAVEPQRARHRRAVTRAHELEE